MRRGPVCLAPLAARCMFSLAALSLLASCASARSHEPATVPMVVIPGVTRTQVMANIADHAAQGGWHVAATTEFSIKLEKDQTGFGAQLAYGSSFNRTPRSRVELTVVELNGAVRVTAQGWIVTNPGSGFESAQPLNSGRDRQTLQGSLDDLKQRMASAPGQ
jgi:hypothetical protein